MSHNIYTPDNWVIIKIKGDDPHYRVLAGWSDRWRLNSGITKVEKGSTTWKFYGSSGSCYECGMDNYMLRMNNAHIWTQLQELLGDKVKLMPEDTDWLNVDWVIK